MHDALKPSLHFTEELYTFDVAARCDIGTFLMHAEHKAA